MKLFYFLLFAIIVSFSLNDLFAAETVDSPNERIQRLQRDIKNLNKKVTLKSIDDLTKKTTLLKDLAVNSKRVFNTMPELNYEDEKDFTFKTGFGLSNVDSTDYYLFNAFPSYTSLDKSMAASINLPLRFSSKGFDFRKEDYKTFTQVLSAFNFNYNYLNSHEDFQFKGNFAEQKELTLGKGSTMYQYNNSPSYEDRKAGINVQMAIHGSDLGLYASDITKGGIIAGDFNAEVLNLLGGSNGKLDLPVLKGAYLGFNYAGDFNKYAGITKIDSSTGAILEDKGSMNTINGYLQMRLFDKKEFNIDLYGDYSKIFNFGDNFSAGMDLVLDLDKYAAMTVTLQRRFQKGKFLPTYFDGFYETDRYSVLTRANGTQVLNSKAAILDSVQELGGSTLGQVSGHLAKQLYFLGAYQKIDKGDLGGELFLVAALPKLIENMAIYGGYYKRRITDSKQIFTFDENAYFFGRLDYLFNNFIIFSLSYRQTFAAERDAQNNVIGYSPQKVVQPEVNFVFPFGR